MPPIVKGEHRILVLGFLLVSLWATVTNVVPLSVLFVCMAPWVLFTLLKNRALPKSVLLVAALYAYFLLSTLLYAPESLVSPDFYRRDGNFFVCFLPILIGGSVAMKVDLGVVVRRFVMWASLVNAAFIGVYLVTGGTIFYAEPGMYHFLFESHNAAGGYISMVEAFALGIYYRGRRSFLWLVLLLVNVFGLVLTVSRGSQLALLLAGLLVLRLRERFARSIVFGMAIVTMGILTYTYPHWLAVGKPNGWADVAVGTITSGDANILDRLLYLWPRAVDLFFRSPLVGTGFGSYDDLPYRFIGIPYVFSYNDPVALTFSSAHAHNSYLHILAETGLVGFSLTMGMLYAVRKDIERVASSSVRLGLRIGFWVTIFSSVTEHRMFTPSQMLPFAILYGLAMADVRWAGSRSATDAAQVPAPRGPDTIAGTSAGSVV